jgi:hypothetical protein
MLVRRIPAIAWLALGLVLAGAAPVRAANDTALRLANVSSSNTGYVRVPNDAAFSLQTFTLEAWVQRVGAGYGFTTDGGGAGIIAKPHENAVGSNIASWHFDWNNSGQIVFNLTHTLASSGLYLNSAAVATPLAPHHLAVTFDGSTVRLYVDGALSASGAWSLGTVYYGADDILIGANNFGVGYFRRFDGYIDDVRVWDHARTATEIANTMSCGLTGSEPGLVAYWSFDGSNLTDLTGHGHNGTAVATAGAVSFAPLSPLGACTAGVGDHGAKGVASISMSVFPQPATGSVTVSFALPRSGPVTVDVLDVAGRRLAVWESRDYAAGPHQITEPLGALGSRASASGVMFVRLRSGTQTVVRTLVVRR